MLSYKIKLLQVKKIIINDCRLVNGALYSKTNFKTAKMLNCIHDHIYLTTWIIFNCNRAKILFIVYHNHGTCTNIAVNIAVTDVVTWLYLYCMLLRDCICTVCCYMTVCVLYVVTWLYLYCMLLHDCICTVCCYMTVFVLYVVTWLHLYYSVLHMLFII